MAIEIEKLKQLNAEKDKRRNYWVDRNKKSNG
jgi:hypothetical protein